MRILITVFVLLGSVQVKAIEDDVCYDGLGCFNTSGLFTFNIKRPISVVPQSPEEIKTGFILITKESISKPQYLNATDTGDVLKVFTNFVDRPTKIIVHGFLENYKIQTWLLEMAQELLKQGDYNVIVVDWSGGAQLPYFQATANTKLVGAQIAELINSLIEAGLITAKDIHIIGHSLGAHTAGFAGQKITGTGRITGLDPAGPYFSDVDINERLDATDALFVDIIHTDQSGFGTTTPSGHVGFFPNGGQNQPGCPDLVNNIKQSGPLKGLFDAVFCSHTRSVKLFIESINSACPFLAYPCPSKENFQNKQCETCGSEGCIRMGFYAEKPRAGQTATYYLRTGDKKPFCSYGYTITVKLSAGVGLSVSGIASISITGDLATSAWQSLPGFKDTPLNPGETYTFYVDLPQDVGKVSSVSFEWKKAFSFFSIGQVASLNIEFINVYAREANATYKKCNNGQRVDSGDTIVLSKDCSSDE